MRVRNATLVAVLLVAGMTGLAQADEPRQQAEQSPAEGAIRGMEEMMAQLATPGEPHKHLQQMAGNYKTIATWMIPGVSQTAAPGETTDEGTARFYPILGGRFVVQEFKSKYSGVPMEGFGVMGYDNAQRKFIGVWMDTMGTGMLRTEGTLDEKTGVVTETGTMQTPAGAMKFKMTTKPTEKGFIFTLAQDLGETEQPMGRIEYIKQ